MAKIKQAQARKIEKRQKGMNMDEIREFIRSSSPESGIYVGCDSRRFRKKGGKFYASYAVVVVIHKNCNNGCKVFGEIRTLQDYGHIRQRLMQEVQLAVEVANEIIDDVGDRKFEIHLDINSDVNAVSNAVLKEARGYALTTGIEPTFKPDALASSFAAHAMVHGVM